MIRPSPAVIVPHIERHTCARAALDVVLIPPPEVALSLIPGFNNLNNVILVPASTCKRLLEIHRRKRIVGIRVSHHSCTRGLLTAKRLDELSLLADHLRLTVVCLRIEPWVLAVLWVLASHGDLTVGRLLTEPRMLAMLCLLTRKWIWTVRGLLVKPWRHCKARARRTVLSLPHLWHAAPVRAPV